MKNTYGPSIKISEEIHQMKYRADGEDFKTAMARVADHLKDDEDHYQSFKDILYHMRFLPGGRVQSASGATRQVTAFNCFVMNTIPDSMDGIMKVLAEAAETMRLGGGVGYDFSTLRPRGTRIKTLDTPSSGPLSFMEIYNALCKTISSAGHRRGAQMGCLRVDHPDIEEFITAKNNATNLTQFNISVLVTDKFMEAVKADDMFDLVFEGRVFRTVKARALWEKILRSTWDWAEPGVIFIDRINKKNNLWYIEDIAATNPCGEQPLPPYGACLLGSYNMTKYTLRKPVEDNVTFLKPSFYFDWDQLRDDIHHVVRAMDNVIDRTVYPLEQQKIEAQNKRRMGLGVTGMANSLEALGYKYGSDEYIAMQEEIMGVIRNESYRASIQLAKEKGAFPLFREELLQSDFAKTLPQSIQDDIKEFGLRNSHLLSVAPTGTISLTADNISSGIEPVFSHYYDRTIQTFDGPRIERVEDYAYREWGFKCTTANELSVFDHVRVLNSASKFVDSACSKTCNVGDDVSWHDFKEVYMEAYEGGASGCTTFRAAGKRYGILNASHSEDVADEPEVPEDNFIDEGGACYYDPATGKKQCE